MVGELYRLYSRKSTDRNKLFKHASVISAVLSVAIIFFMHILVSTYQLNIDDNTKAMNGASVKIGDKDYLEHEFSQEQVDSITELFSKEKTAYTLGCCDITNVIFRKTDNMVPLTVLNNNNMAENMKITPLKDNEMAMSEDAAKRIGVKEGDALYVKLHSDLYADMEFKITQIIKSNMLFSVAGNEYEIGQEALGNAYVVLPDFDRYNVAFSDCNNSTTIKEIKSDLAPYFEARTYKRAGGRCRAKDGTPD